MEQNQDQTNEVEQEENCPVEENTQDKDNMKKPSKAQRIRSAIFELLVYVAIIVVCVMVVPRYVIQRTIVDGTSMEATLQDQDNLLVDKLSYRFSNPKRFDVIVFYPYGRENEDYYIKRVIGLPGETIQIVGDTIYIDGKVLKESYGKDPMTESGMASEPLKLGKDEYFVERDDGTRKLALSANVVLTPHLQEMTRLTRFELPLIRARIVDQALLALECANGQTLVLKDARTVVTDGGEVYINTTGNNALSTGGTGDVLTGMIAGLLAQGMRPKRAAVLAVCLHGIAADEYVRDRGGRYSMIASDLLDMLPQILPK